MPNPILEHYIVDCNPINSQKDEKEVFHKSFKNHFALFSLFLRINHSKVIKTVEFYIVKNLGVSYIALIKSDSISLICKWFYFRKSL
jgi:hypothetical protein